MRKIVGRVLIVLGVIAVGAAAAVHWVLVPRMAQLPGDMSTTRIYSGTAKTVANPTATTGVLVGPGVLRDVPVTVRHSDRVLKTHGDQALIADQRAIDIPGFTVADLTYWFDINRKTFDRAYYPAWQEDVAPSRGVTFNWPMGTKAQDYIAWVPDTQQTVTARYAGTAKRGGVETYVYKVDVPEGRITDPQLLRVLPASMTKQQLMEITPSLQFSMKRLLALNALMARLPDPVQLAYTYRSTSTFWVNPTTGIVVDLQSHEVRTLNFLDGSKLVPINPVIDMTYSAPPATLAAAANDAKSGTAQLKLLRTTLPVSLLIGGIVFLLVGAGLLLAGRKFEPPLGDEELAAVLLEDNVRVPLRVD